MKELLGFCRRCGSRAVLTLTSILVIGFLLSLSWAQTNESSGNLIERQRDYLLSNYRMSDVEDVQGWFSTQQIDYLPIAPPDFDPFLQPGCPGVLPFDWINFPAEFNRGLVGRNINGVSVYHVFVIEDSETRETVFYN